ncbi:MAG: hypothetical protein KGI70_01665 [Patescibacteria group bacterium]|nr:hypothetical protein [Patescibacteria group bacterium]
MPAHNDKQDGLTWSTPSPKPASVKPPISGASTTPPIPVIDSRGFVASMTQGVVPTLVGTLAGGIIIGVVAAWGYSALVTKGTPATTQTYNQNATSAQTQTQGQQQITAQPGTSAGAPSVVAQKAGSTVTVSAVNVESPTWVVVYESRNGAPGNALGATLFFPGQSSGNVELLRPTIAGETYFVGESTDNGDRKFELHGDTQVTAEDGSVLWGTFVAQ